MQDEQDLRELNKQLVEAERQGNKKFFEQYLADDLIFRRAKGEVVTKQQFLYDLKPDVFEKLVSNIVDLKIYQDCAVVKVNVIAKRREEAEGEYLNVRRFIKRDGQWQLVAWLNTKVQKAVG